MPNIGIVDLHSLLCVFDHFASFSSATFSRMNSRSSSTVPP